MGQRLAMTITPQAGYSHAAALMQAHAPLPDIRWRDVSSSNVLRVGWDRDMNLYAEFNSGGTYKYKGVSRQRAVACSRAKSVGRYFNKIIKPNYKAVKIA